MQNTTICYEAIQRIYRNAVVNHIRKCFDSAFDTNASEKIKSTFSKEWDEIVAAANASRISGELKSEIEDDFEYLGVNHFFNLFDSFFDQLFVVHSDLSKSEKNLTKKAILSWTQTIKTLRDPLSHPVTQDFTVDDTLHMLRCAIFILEALQLFEEADKIKRMQRSLIEIQEADYAVVHLPTSDEVVTHFVGRKKELLQLRRWLEDPNTPKWALSGDGGKGKSSIAYYFAGDIAHFKTTNIESIIWLSAKKRRFVRGSTQSIDRPDFKDDDTFFDKILEVFSETDTKNLDYEAKYKKAHEYLEEFPALLIIDDIDTLDGDDLAVVPKILDIPAKTKSKLLITSRRDLFGMEACTTRVSGLNREDVKSYLVSRCELMQLPVKSILKHIDSIISVTDSSPLYIEDLLRLTLSGLNISQAIGTWRKQKGTAAREYSIKREFDQLPDDAKEVLFTLSLMNKPCTFDELCAALDWHEDRLSEANQSLRQMFLMPNIISNEDGTVTMTLNNNTKKLIRDVFEKSSRFKRVERNVNGVLGQLNSSKIENRIVESKLKLIRAQITNIDINELPKSPIASEAINHLDELNAQYPGRNDIPSIQGWVYKKSGKYTDARVAFKRSFDMKSKDPHMFWHWADMEASEEEWLEAIRISELGIDICPNSKSLKHCLGYSQNRLAHEYEKEGLEKKALPLFKKSENNLLYFLENDDGFGGYVQHCRALKGLVLISDSLSDARKVATYLKRWKNYAPNDPSLKQTHEKMRQLHPDRVPHFEDL